MKKIVGLGSVLLICSLCEAQNVGINTTGASPNSAAIFDLNTGNTFTPVNTAMGRGFLVPNVPISSTTDITSFPAASIGAATSGMLIYNTNAAGAGSTAVSPGYYYWDNTLTTPAWVPLLAGNGELANGGWLLTGNYGTTAGTNYVGTNDAKDLVFKTNSTEDMRIQNTTGNVGIGTTNPLSILHIGASQRQPAFRINCSSYPTTYSSIWGLQSNSASILILGNNTFNEIRAGNTTTGGWLDFYTNNTANYTVSSNGNFVMRLTATGNVGMGTKTPSASAILDLTNTTGGTYALGLLPPSVALTATNSILPYTASTTPANGLIVYNTANSGSAPTNVVANNYYYYNTATSSWVLFTNSSNYSTVIGTPINVSTPGDNSTAGVFSTTSAAYQPVTGASLTISTIGVYLILANAEVSSSSNVAGTTVVLTDGTNYYGNSTPYTAGYAAWSTTTVATINASTTYTIQIAKNSGGVTAYCRNARITAIKLQ